MKNALIAEDETLDRDLLVLLPEKDQESVTAADGLQVTAAARLARADLGCVGWEVTESIGAHPSLSQMPIIVLAAPGMFADERRAFAVGCDACITKSLNDVGISSLVRQSSADGDAS